MKQITFHLFRYQDLIFVSSFSSQKSTINPSTMDINSEVSIAAIVLSIVAFVGQIILCFAVFHIFMQLRRMRQMIEDLSLVRTSNNSCPDSQPSRNHLIPLGALPGESVTVLRRPSGPPLPPEFLIEEVEPQQTESLESKPATTQLAEHDNKGFEGFNFA